MLLGRLPTFFISHGGGPWPYIPEMKLQFARTAQWLSSLPKTFNQKPKAILSISGHWEEAEFTVSTAKEPPMIYDYSGFPEHTYQIKYPAQGSPEIAQHINNLLQNAGIKNLINSAHGFDHGTFVPLFLMYPNAEIPVISMSLKANYSPSEHLKMGNSLKSLRDEGVLIIGSGLSYHNMRAFFNSSIAGPVSVEFGKWLAKIVTEKNIAVRNSKLIDWEKAPAARQAHPQEDHLLPLMVVAGAAGEDLGKIVFVDTVNGIEMASYGFGV